MRSDFRAAAVVLATLCAGCTFEWNSMPPPFPVEGNPPPLSSFDKLNKMPALHSQLMAGPDGVSWVTFCDTWVGGAVGIGRTCKRMHLVRLGSPFPQPSIEDFIEADDFMVGYFEIYAIRDVVGADLKPKARTITLHRPGDTPADEVTFAMPPGPQLLYVGGGGAEEVFVYWVLDAKTTHFDVYRRDQAHHRSFPIPAGVDPAQVPDASVFDFLLTADGKHLVVRDAGGQMTAYSTLDDTMVLLGPRPADFFFDADRQPAVFTVGADGFRAVPLDGRPDLVLAQKGFNPATRTFLHEPIAGMLREVAYYVGDGGLWRVPLDGSAPAGLVIPGGARVLAHDLQRGIVYSRDRDDRYAGGAGDGWVGDVKVMERGRRLRWSGDGTRVRFLEHSATLGTYGDLTSVLVAGGAALTLGLNVHAFAELSDGRVLALENRVYAGSWNRLVVVDEARGTKKWVVPATTEFLLTPDSKEIIADVVSGASGYDILRVPVPAP